LRRFSAVRPNFPNTVLLWVGDEIHDPFAIRRHGRVFAVEAAARDLARICPVRIRPPNLELTGAVRTEKKILSIGRKRWVPVIGGIVGESSDHAVAAMKRPDIQITGSIRGEDDFLLIY